MFSKISAKLKTVLSVISPRLYSYAIMKGLISDSKFINMDGDYKKYNFYTTQNVAKRVIPKHREWFVNWILKKSPCTVMDVGAGGMHELRLLNTFKKSNQVDYTVAEIAKSFLEQGRKEFPKSHFIECSINRIKSPKNSFDIVYTSATLEHQPYYTKAIDELFRVSKNFVVISLWRWAEKDEILKRKALNYLNTYKITDILECIESKSSSMLSLLILKNAELNRLNDQEEERDGNIVNTGDRLVIIATKSSQKITGVTEVLNKLNYNYILNPYDKENPILVNI